MTVIKTTGIPTYSFRATCSNCSYSEDESIANRIATARLRVKNHVKNMKHTVSIEKKSGIIYSPIED